MNRPFSRPILWPLVLIALGVLWLLSNFGVIAGANLWILLRLWPVLLIAIGLDLLVRHRWPWVGNLIAVVTVGLAVLAVIFAPRLGWEASGSKWISAMPFVWGGAPGSGRVVTETRDVSGFDTVAFSSFGDLTIQQGQRESLSIEGEDNVLAEISTEVRNGALHIGFADDNGWLAVRPTKPIRFTLVVKNLAGLDLSGAGNVVVQTLKADQLQATLSGAGSLKFDNLEAGAASYRMSGAGTLTASGKVKTLEARLSGLGSYEGQGLQAESAVVTISGAGSATVRASSRLDAHISGLGSVRYYGQPQVTQEVSGLGSIQRLDDK